MEWLPCVARPTFALVWRTNLAAKESIGKPTTWHRRSTWMFSCRRSLERFSDQFVVVPEAESVYFMTSLTISD
jgi:hypothetical protein